MTKPRMMLLTLSILMTLVGLLLLFGGCAKTVKQFTPVIEGVDLIWLEKGETVIAPVKGAFVSDDFMKYVLEYPYE